MGLDPEIWGPKGWFFLHSITLNYPDNPTTNDKQNYKMFFESLKNVLPCEFCSKHFKENFDKHPLNDEILNTKKNLVNWLIEMHNEVNRLDNKKIYKYREVIDLYKNIYTPNNNNNIFVYVFIAVVICIIIYIILKK
jgi:hypothetical protein